MRAGPIISALAHAGVLAWVLLGTPKPFETASGEPIAVDLVTLDEVPQEMPKPPEPPKPKQAETPPLLIPPRETAVSEKPRPALPSSPQAQASVPAQPQRNAAAPPTPAAQPQRNAAAPPTPAAPPQRNAAAAPNSALPPQQADPAASIFDPASIPKLFEIAPTQRQAAAASAPEYDALADVAASLSSQEVATFKAHLRKCLRLPAGVDAARELRVIMRVFLKPDGALAADPMLVAAPAAQEGPALVLAATQAFKACQPYALPAEKYNEWKTLDITLSPRDMAGG